MNLLSGLEKFGIKVDNDIDLYKEEKKTVTVENGDKKEEVIPEESYLLDKTIRCIVCDKVFKVKTVKNGRVKRLEPDRDLRPRAENIDTLKYTVYSCPHCGYTAMSRYFEHLLPAQVKLINEQICSKFSPTGEEESATVDYDKAIERFKLALFTAVVKKAKSSEKAYICLNTAWLYRGKAETLDAQAADYKQQKQECAEQEEAFYKEAYDGFMQAVSSEMFPICGMDQSTMDFLLAGMSHHYKRYDIASKCIANILAAPSSSARMKDKARELKEEIVQEIKKSKQA